MASAVVLSLLASVSVALAGECPRPAALRRQLDRPPTAGRVLQHHRALTGTLSALRTCAGPEHATELARAFTLSRHGPLAEDPDIFEAALDGLQRLPPDVTHRALEDGLCPALLSLVWADLRVRWLGPTLVASPDAHAEIEQWDPADNPALLDAGAQACSRVLDGHDLDPSAFLAALSVDGGSISHDAAADVQDALMAGILATSNPEIWTAVARVSHQGGLGGARLRAALSTGPPRPEDAALVLQAINALPERSTSGPLLPPAVAPGQLPGLEAVSPVTAYEDAILARAHPPFWSTGVPRMAFGLAGLIGFAAVALRRRRPWAALGLAVSTMVVVDGALAWASPPRSPELGFIPTPRQLPTVESTTCTYGGPGTRIEAIPCTRDRGVPLVAVLGASSAHGSHFVAEDAFPARLQARLREDVHPSARVVNLGVGGATSATLAGFAGPGGIFDPAAGGPPDVVVVYYGHNEASQFVRMGDFAAVRPSQMAARLFLARSGIFAVLEGILPKSAPVAAHPPDRTLDPRASRDRLISLAALHLKTNLGWVLDVAHQAGTVPVVVIPATNLRFAHVEPFADGGPGDTADLNALRRLGEEAAKAGQREAAARYFQQAIDRSASPRELVSPIRTAISTTATGGGADLIDAQAAFLARAPDGVTPSGLFWDDLHPSRAGHQVLADLIAPVVADHLTGVPGLR